MKMASPVTAATAERTSKDTNIDTDVSLEVPSMESRSASPVIVSALSATECFTEDSFLDSTKGTDVPPVMPLVDAANVPLPEDEGDQDMFETSPLDDHGENAPRSDNVEVANNEPTDVDITGQGQDDAQMGIAHSHHTSLSVAFSYASSPRTPRSQDRSSSDSEDHNSTTSLLSSINSPPQTPPKESCDSDPFVDEDPTKGLSLDSLDWSSLHQITNFLQKLEHLKPDAEEALNSNPVKAFEEGVEYDGSIIAIPDTPEYHPYSNYFQVRLSKYGGFGTFATRDLKMGEVILIEKPLLRTSRKDFHSNFLKLSKHDQEAFMQLYLPPGNYRTVDGTDFNHIRAIVAANSFAVNPYSSGIIGVYNIASRLNHACLPVANVLFDFDAKNSGAIVLKMSKPVKAGSELFISYGGSPMSLYERYGFRCCCGGCESVSDQEISIMKKRKEYEWMV